VRTWATDGLDLLVNNAGGIPLGGDDPAPAVFATIDDEAGQRTLELNLLSAVRVTRALVDPATARRSDRQGVVHRSEGGRSGHRLRRRESGLTNLTKAL
jgi:putative oxidoreductase